MRFILLTIFSLLSGFIGFSQLGSATLTTDKCAHISTRIDINYGNSVTFDVSTDYNRGVTYYSRGFIEFDLSSIPTNATIISAKLKITNAGGTYVANPWVAKLLESSWVESTIKASVQPSISSSPSDWETSYTTSGNDIEIDVKNTVQRMVYEAVPNYGWSIEVEDETVAYDSGTSFHSDDASSDEPELIIEYYKPVTLSDVLITHESGPGQSDGSISFSHTALDGSGHTYTWYNSSGTQLQTGSTSTIEELAYGWYGLEIKGDLNEEIFNYAFLVGTECQEVTIEFDPDYTYVDNASNFNLIYGGVDYGDYNSGNNVFFKTSSEDVSGSYDHEYNSLMRFRLWMPEDVSINQAKLFMKGDANTGANAASLVKVNSYWDEMLVTWNNPPTSTATPSMSMPQTTSSTLEQFDMIDFWNDWQQSNTDNEGVLFELDTYGSPIIRQRYHSPTATTSADRPSIEFVIDLYHDDVPFRCFPLYAMAKRKLTGILYKSVEDQFYFAYENEYAATSVNLDYAIYQQGDILDPEMDGVSDLVTLGEGLNQRILDVSSLSSGEVYILEITNEKGEKRYLRFEKN